MQYLYILPWTTNWYIVIGGFAFTIFSFLFLGRVVSEKWRNRILSFIGFYLLFDLIFIELYLYYYGSFSIKTSLPLAFCSVMHIAAIIAALKRSKLAFELVLFYGIAGPIQAFISPALVYRGEAYLLIDFFVAHGLTIITPLYMAVCCGFKPRQYAAFKTLAIMQMIIFGVYFANVYLDANYMYLCKRPKSTHPLNTGIWPYYLLNWHALFYGVALLIQSCYWVVNYIGVKTTDRVEF